MEAQEVFDKIVAHLRKQGTQAKNPDTGKCMYRAPDGKKCAVGSLIEDEEYSPEMEGYGIGCSPILFAHVFCRIGCDNKRLMSALQEVHDNQVPNKWEYSLRKVAKDFDLVYTSPI